MADTTEPRTYLCPTCGDETRAIVAFGARCGVCGNRVTEGALLQAESRRRWKAEQAAGEQATLEGL